jgi:electron transfer flavoprotein alpha subunit
MTILVIADHDNVALGEATARVVAAAAALAQDIDVLVAGANVGAVATAAAGLQHVRTILVADHPALEYQLAEDIAPIILGVADDYDLIAFAANSAGKDLAPRVAAKLDLSLITDVIEILSQDIFVRPIYAGSALEKVQSSDPRKIITVRPSAFRPATSGASAAVRELSVEVRTGRGAKFVSAAVVNSNRPHLDAAKIVVSGGRAFGSADEFRNMLEPLADRLGAAIGASRAAVDAGYAPNDFQIGQTGKVVAPEIYLAIGISGAIQHLAGMKDSRIIVAINKDEEAPIFQVADFGLVADYQRAIPELLSALPATGM